MRPTRLLAGGVGAAVSVVASAGPAGAHGIGGRNDLPVPTWLAMYGVITALVGSFLMLGVAWRSPRLRAAIAGGDAGIDGVPVLVTTRAIGLAAFALVLVAAWFGRADSGATIAPLMVYVVLWVAVPMLSLLVGDLWRLLDPIDTLARLVERVRPADGTAGPGPSWTRRRWSRGSSRSSSPTTTRHRPACWP